MPINWNGRTVWGSFNPLGWVAGSLEEVVWKLKEVVGPSGEY